MKTSKLGPISLVASCCIGVAHGQSSPPVSGNSDEVAGTLEEIVVTAQRRSENLQNVPIAVTAISEESLARNGITDLTDLGSVVPGLNIQSGIGYLTSQLRGVGTTNVAVGFENPVALYVDGVYYAAADASVLNLTDVERVEVLKGPQGTLFGRNATGGLIQLVTKDPSHELGGSADVSYGNFDTLNGNLYLTGGLTQNVAADIAIQAGDQAQGWGRNRYNGEDVYKVDHTISARSKFVYESDDTRVALSLDYSDLENSLSAQVLSPGTFSGSGGGGPYNLPGWDTDTNVQPLVESTSEGVTLQVSQDLGLARLNSISAYRNSHFLNILDIDETPVPASAFRLSQGDRQFSEELQLLSTHGGPLTWVVGAYYFKATSKWNPFTVTLAPPTPVPLPLNVSSNDDIGTQSIAGYAQGTLALGAQTNLTLGGRFTHEIRSRDGVQTTTAGANGLLPIAPGVAIPITAGQMLGPPVPFPESDLVYNRFTPRITLDHELAPEVLGYVSFNEGFKSGGYNPAVYNLPLVGGYTYRPEQLVAYELGLKSTLFDRRMRLNAAAFYYDYSNLQLPFTTGTTILTINGAEAHIYGVDGDWEYQVTNALRLTAGIQAINDHYVSFPRAPIGTAAGGMPLTVGSAAGNRLSLVPSVTVNPGIDYTIPAVGDGSLNFGANAGYSSGFYTTPDNLRRQADYVLLNATVRWNSRRDFWVGLYGKNLANYRIIATQTENYDGTTPTEWAAPRMYGVTVGYRF